MSPFRPCSPVLILGYVLRLGFSLAAVFVATTKASRVRARRVDTPEIFKLGNRGFSPPPSGKRILQNWFISAVEYFDPALLFNVRFSPWHEFFGSLPGSSGDDWPA